VLFSSYAVAVMFLLEAADECRKQHQLPLKRLLRQKRTRTVRGGICSKQILGKSENNLPGLGGEGGPPLPSLCFVVRAFYCRLSLIGRSFQVLNPA
jgi:hypothetical protein